MEIKPKSSAYTTPELNFYKQMYKGGVTLTNLI